LKNQALVVIRGGMVWRERKGRKGLGIDGKGGAREEGGSRRAHGRVLR